MSGTQDKPINLADLKNTSDDQIGLTNIRLALGYASVVVAAFVGFYDKHYGFFEAYNVTAVGLVLYVLLSGAYFYWMRFVERGVVYTGLDSQGATVRVYTDVPDKYTPTYKIRIVAQGDKKLRTAQASFTEWFGRNGMIVYDKFEAWVVETLNGDNAAPENKKSK